MDFEQARSFVGEHHHAVMSTFRSDGRPALSPVACGVDEAGRVVVSTRETAMKVAHLRRDPRVALCVMSDTFYGDWVQIEGRAQVVSLPDAMEPLVDYYRSLSGEHPDWEDYRAAMRRDQRVIVRIEIERAGPDVQG